MNPISEKIMSIGVVPVIKLNNPERDSVNLASRLEGINKQFGLYTLCSEETKLQAEKFGTKLIFIEIAKVQVIGKSNIVTVFTPITNTEFEESKLLWKIFEEEYKISQVKILLCSKRCLFWREYKTKNEIRSF